MKSYFNLDKQFVLECAKESTSEIEFSRKLGCTSRDGIRLSRIKQLEHFFHISIIEQIHKNYRKKRDTIKNRFLETEYICDNCNKKYKECEHHSTSRNGRHFCSYFCSKQFASKCGNTSELRQSKANKLKKIAKETNSAIQRKAAAIRNQKYHINRPIYTCRVCGKNIPSNVRRKSLCSVECEKIFRKSLGGYREKSSRGKRGYYKGFYCASTYELAFVIYCLDHNIKIERNIKSYPYLWNGKQHLYYPDWLIDNKKLVETKNYISEQVKVKANAVKDMPIEILDKYKMKPILAYVAKTYNKKLNGFSNNFDELYDKKF